MTSFQQICYKAGEVRGADRRRRIRYFRKHSVAAMAIAVALGTTSQEARAQDASRPIGIDAEGSRIERLQLLADVWGRVFLFHPTAGARQFDEEGAMARTIKAIDTATTAAAVVDALNRELLATLNDPLTYAFLDDGPYESGPVSPVQARLLTTGVGYLSLVDPRALEDPALFTKIAGEVARLGPIERLVVDARWIRSHAPEWSAEWLRLWVDSTLLMGSRVARQHMGWSELSPVSCCPNLYRQTWIQEPRLPFAPLRQPDRVIARLFRGTDFASIPIIRTPTLVLVNRTSYEHLERELDALQAIGSVAVALEPLGKPLGDRGVITHQEGVRVHTRGTALLGSSGKIGSTFDFVSQGPISLEEVPSLAAKITPSPRSSRPEFAAPPFWLPDSPVDTTLTREARLFGLFKVWAVIEHLYPHKQGIAGDWSRVLADVIPEVEAAQSVRDYTRAMLALAARLNDNHANFSVPGVPLRPPWTIPAWIDRVEGKALVIWPIPGGPDENPLRVGDEIVTIDGSTPNEIIESYRSIVSSSQPSAYLYTIAMAGLIGTRGPQGSEALIRIRRGGRISSVRVRRSQRTPIFFAIQDRQPLARRLAGNIGYINLGRIEGSAMLDSLFREFRGLDGIVLDNRSGRGVDDYHAVINNIGDEIVSRWQTPTADMLSGDVRHGAVEQQSRSMEEPRTPRERYRKPIVVLTAPTQSGGEALPEWLRDQRRGLTVGATTAGAQGNISIVTTPGGGQFSFSAMRVLNPDGTDFQRVGTVPDVPVSFTVAGVRSGRDEVLDRGVEVLRTLVSKARLRR